jgi:hypothetical protein
MEYCQVPIFLGPQIALQLVGHILVITVAHFAAMPRSCISVRFPADCYVNYGMQLSAAETYASQARSRMHCHEGMHLWERIGPALGASACLPCKGTDTFSLPIRALSDTLSPRHTRQPLHGAANFLYNRYKYL